MVDIGFSDSEQAAFQVASNKALEMFPDMFGQCVGVSAWIVRHLRRDGISCRVALGTLLCNGRLAFKYERPIPRRPKGAIDWKGHAWVDFNSRAVGEVSLYRTARALPQASNLKQNLLELGLLRNGASLFSYSHAESELNLKYKIKSYLHEEVYSQVIEGLEAVNA